MTYQARTSEIKTYVVNYFGGGRRSVKPYKYRAIVSIYDDTERVGDLCFHCDAGTMPESDTMSDTGVLVVHYPAEDLSRVIDILRYEGPVYLHQYAHWPTMAHLSTSKEPVGEGELGI